MEPGIDMSILEHLIKKVDNLIDEEKICALVFDRMSLRKGCIYKPSKGTIRRLDDGDPVESTEYVADHVLVFMLQGIYRKIKQPIAMYFMKGMISSDKLATLINTVVNIIVSIGYNILTIVCNHSPTNVSAMNILKNKSDIHENQNYFLFKDEKIFIIYDVPHLYKSICKTFIESGEMLFNSKKAEWRHLVKLVDKKDIQKLNQSRIKRVQKRRSGIKVRTAARILSNTVAGMLKLMSINVRNDRDSYSMRQTGDVVEELDHLFDCTNGPITKEELTSFRSNVTSSSFHHQLWPTYKSSLKSLKFLKSDSHIRLRNNRYVHCYIITIMSLEDIWDYVTAKSLYFLNLRLLNLDNMEKFFRIMRYCMKPKKNVPIRNCFKGALLSPLLKHLVPDAKNLN